MLDIDIHDYARRIECVKNLVKNSKISEGNKQLITEFMGDCRTGWGGKKLTDARVSKLIAAIKILSEMLEKDWEWATKEDIKRIILKLDADPEKGEWAQHDYRIILRKFVAWLRAEHSYPSGYPEREEFIRILSIVKYPVEVGKIKINRPDRLKPAEEIPTQTEMQYLSDAAINPRDKAFFEMAKEVGIRIGGLGSRQLKHISFDELGAQITMHDKTMRGEPVRYISSVSYLHVWLENHPFKTNPEAPLWIDLGKTAKGPVPLDYSGFRALILRTVERHNKRAENLGLPKITKRIHTHLFRYHAQTRDELDGVPRSIMCKQRGWKTDSKQPERYARIVTKDVDSYYAKKFGITGGEIKEQPKPGRCPRCKELNAPGMGYCFSEETEVDIGEGKHVVYMVRLAAKTDDEIVKSIVKEVSDASKKALTSEDYAEIGRVHFNKDTEDVRYYDLQPDSQPITTQIKQLYETYCSYLTGKQIRVMFHEIIKSMSPTLVRPSGAVYFIPYAHVEMVQKMEVLSKELSAYDITDYESAFESIPLIDADKTRALVEVRFEEQNTRDVDRTLVELSKLLQGTDTTTKTAAKYVGMVKASKETIARYEGLLNKEMSIARMKVEVLDQQVQKLVEKVAQQPLIPPRVEEKKTAEHSIAVVVPHTEQAQESAAAKPVLPAPIEGIAVAAPARPEAHNIVGGFTVVVPKAEQTPKLEQSEVMKSDVKVDEMKGVLVIPEPVLQTEANIKTETEADPQLEGNSHKPQRPVSVMNAPIEFTSESLLA